jgi:hypothetical protein
MKRFINALIAAVCIQTAALAAYCDYPAVAALLLMVATVAIIDNLKATGAGMQRRTRRRVRDALATLILVGGLIRFFHPFGGDGSGISAPRAGSTSAPQPDTKFPADSSGDHTGIILLPERDEHTVLVPPLPSMSRDLFDSHHKNPLSIPFYGAYWFFKLPDTEPPPNSYRTHGTPSKLTFFSPDLRPLLMEAHQNLGKLINLTCCREIQVEIVNADRYPGTVSVELVLKNTREGEEGSVSLGSAPVTSSPENPDSPMKETLTFPIPARASISQFDELMIRFPRRRTRIFRSAKIAIQRFVMIPRG